MLTADPDADLEAALARGRRLRRRQRVAAIHWVDALYQVYISAIIGAIVLYALAALVGDERVSAAGQADVRAHGADWLGLVVAAAVAIGLRSGSRGGPLALEHAEVRHVLLAPVDRTAALRGPALRQLRFLAFAATIAGLEGGLLAAHRLDHHAALWMAWGAAWAVATLAAAYGAALAAASWRLPSPAATAAGVVLVGWALADAAGAVELSPTALWGRIGLAPYGPAWAAIAVAAVLSAAVAVVGLLRVGECSIEAAERRSTLVGQLRFAATLQDLRTVMVLRRQLALEHPRLRPWVRLAPGGAGRFPVWERGWRGVLRWPAARLGRLVLLAAVAGLALRGAWDGTTPLVVLAGVALFVVGTEAVEAMSQDMDRPTRSASVPMEAGDLRLRHLPVAVVVSCAVALVGAAVAVAADPSLGAAAVAAVCVVPAALGAVAGASASVLGGAPDSRSWALAPPEVAGMGMMVRTGFPFVLSTGGTLPVLAARAADSAGRAPVPAAVVAGVGVAVAFGGVAAYVRSRDRLLAAWREATGGLSGRPPAASPEPSAPGGPGGDPTGPAGPSRPEERSRA